MNARDVSRGLLCLALNLCLVVPASAQFGTPPASPPAPAPEATSSPSSDVSKGEQKDAPRGPGFLGDTSRFTRMGGWGSMGGAVAQFGFAKSMLVMLPPVQKELKMTDEQKQQLRDWLDTMRKRGEEWGKSMQGQAGDMRNLQEAPITERISRFTGFMGQLQTIVQENEQGVDRILTKEQRKRLGQISLQMEGISAIGRPEVARSLNLTPGQQEQIAQILAQARLMQMTTWFTRGPMMGNGFRDRNGRPGTQTGGPPSGRPTSTDSTTPASTKSTAPEGTAKSASPDDRAGGRRGRVLTPDEEAERVKREEQMRKQFASMRDETDKIQDRAVTAIIKVLTKRQRANFEKMLGEPFDPSAINTFGPPQRRPGEGGDPPAASTEGAAPAPRTEGR